MNDAEAFLRAKLGDPELRLIVAKDHSSLSPDFRARLRARIADELRVHDDERARVLDLKTPLLRAAGRYLSISHCPVAGGFVVSRKPVGLDLEVASRVKPAVIARISRPGELESAPGAAALWAAKEAAFKALQHAERSPDLASQIEIGDWKSSDSDSEAGTFSVKNLSDFSSRGALGCVIGQDTSILCTFTLAT